jgi:hypothetical protein
VSGSITEDVGKFYLKRSIVRSALFDNTIGLNSFTGLFKTSASSMAMALPPMVVGAALRAGRFKSLAGIDSTPEDPHVDEFVIDGHSDRKPVDDFNATR